MGRLTLWVIAAVSLAAVSQLSGTEAQREGFALGGRIVPVLVTNFPATQNVSGTVQVGNLPLDAEGNLRVSCAPTTPATVRFIGFTQAVFNQRSLILPVSRGCNAEFPGSRVCEYGELLRLIPPPPEWMSKVIAFTNLEQIDSTICVVSAGNAPTACDATGEMLPAACCGL